MSEYDIGKVRITPKGAYSATTTYTALDVVYYNGMSYVYTSETDAAGILPTNTAYWKVFSGGILIIDTLPSASEVDEGQLICVLTNVPVGV